MGSGGIAPPLLTSVLDGCEWKASRPFRFTPGEIDPRYPSDMRLGWAPEEVWTSWSREISCLCQDSNPDSQSHSPSLYRLSYSGVRKILKLSYRDYGPEISGGLLYRVDERLLAFPGLCCRELVHLVWQEGKWGHHNWNH
jgi:hypothetical protein